MYETNRSVYEKMLHLAHLLRHQQHRAHEKHGPLGDTRRGQGRIIALLQIKDEIPTRELAYLLGIRQQSLNELLNKLEKAGYIERHPSLEDGRILLVSLTQAGKAIQPEEDKSDAFLDCLAEDELDAFGASLDKVSEALTRQLDPAGEDAALKTLYEKAKEALGEENLEELLRRTAPHHPHPHPHGPHHGPYGCRPEENHQEEADPAQNSEALFDQK